MMHTQINRGIKRLYLVFFRTAYSKSSTRQNIGVGGIVLLSIPIATFCLGTWQVKRRTWKLNLIDQVMKQNKAPPIELPENLEELSEMEYRRVRVHGKFDHTKELYIGPRQLLTGSEDSGGIFSQRSQSGYQVVTPFRLTGKNTTILVNRGWVPRNKVDPAGRNEGQIKEEIDLVGTVRLPEKRPQFSPKNPAGSTQFFYRDVPTMAQMTNAEPIFIDADADSRVRGGPIGGQTRIAFRNDHFSYIITWYSLCAATSYIWYKKYLHGIKVL